MIAGQSLCLSRLSLSLSAPPPPSPPPPPSLLPTLPRALALPPPRSPPPPLTLASSACCCCCQWSLLPCLAPHDIQIRYSDKIQWSLLPCLAPHEARRGATGCSTCQILAAVALSHARHWVLHLSHIGRCRPVSRASLGVSPCLTRVTGCSTCQQRVAPLSLPHPRVTQHHSGSRRITANHGGSRRVTAGKSTATCSHCPHRSCPPRYTPTNLHPLLHQLSDCLPIHTRTT